MSYDMEMDGLGQDIDALFGLGAVMDVAMSATVLGVSAGAAMMIGEGLFTKVGWFAARPAWQKLLIAAGLGYVGSAAVAWAGDKFVNPGQNPEHWSRQAAGGVAAGLIGWAVLKAGQKYTNMPSVGALAGLGQGTDLLLGVGDNLSVDPYVAIPGQTNGLGQAMNIGPVQQIPGGGYLSGLGDAQRAQAATFVS